MDVCTAGVTFEISLVYWTISDTLFSHLTSNLTTFYVSPLLVLGQNVVIHVVAANYFSFERTYARISYPFDWTQQCSRQQINGMFKVQFYSSTKSDSVWVKNICPDIASDHSWVFVRNGQIVVSHCLMTDCYLQHCSKYIT